MQKEHYKVKNSRIANASAINAIIESAPGSLPVRASSAATRTTYDIHTELPEVP
jgi:hypothetical protein